ncbi:MAG: undecaprenyl/decaprenyl-phosphate alpha-N-acetylglucosaminyl 1-phosphate transferase [Gammaproteobacteria bacterium]|nr:undecaprenyl/decaprenyl-phosphate alpha-N-acetylglucosaminyl 1-phosphate transferase [Gammaproteobacteria bacterium]
MLKFVRILDHPNHRSSHQNAIPKSGGISIVATFLIGMAAIAVFSESGSTQQKYMIGFVSSSILIAIISFIDDISEKTAAFKLITHVIAVFVVLYCGIVIDTLSMPWAEQLPLGWAGYVISFFWILGLTNAYNFMDGIDGLVASTALITSLFFMIISYYAGSTFVYISCYTIIAGSVGFLIYNAPPAKIFMGDVGSAFLGFVFATLAIIAARYDASHTSFLVMPMLLFHFIFDTLFTFFRRLSNGEKALQAHRSHLYQLLVRSGYTHLEVTLLLSCMGFLQGLGALWLVNIPGNERLFVFIPFLIIQLIYAKLTLKRARKAGVEYN